MKEAFILVLLLSLGIPLFAQEGWTIESVHFDGLRKTKADYLYQFLASKNGNEFSQVAIEEDIQQLWNVGTNQRVHVKIDTLSDKKIRVTYQLKEKRTLLPILNFGGIRDNIWFQAGAVDFNFTGRGHQLLAFYQNTDNRHGGQLYYRIPFLNKNWGVAFNLLQWRSEEPLFFSEGTVLYDYDNLVGGLTVIRNFGFRKRLELSANAFREQYSKNDNQTLDNPPGPDALTEVKFSPKAEYIENLLNYNDFYLKGWAWRLILQGVYNFENSTIFNSLILQIRKFNRIGKKGNLAVRFRFGISTNNDSPFAPFVVDSRVNLRGSGNRIERGTGQLILNAEYRHTVLDFDDWAVQGVAFSDLGNWRTPGGELSEFIEREELRHFVGLGFRVIFKPVYNAILRVDYGVDVYNARQRGLVVGIGQYF